MTGNVATLQVHFLMCVVLSKEEKPLPYGKLVIPLNVSRYRQDVALSEVVTTKFYFTYIISC